MRSASTLPMSLTPILMAAIANDTTKQVLIFKQSAGTGFDAPRAFVLASIKPVNDADFAMQFIGRVIRVARQVREAFPGRRRFHRVEYSVCLLGQR